MRTQVRVTWAELEREIRLLASKMVEHNWRPLGLYGVPSGGVPVALLLRRALDDILGCAPELTGAPDTGVWVVDDICDSGETLARYPGHLTAVLHVRPSSAGVPTVFLRQTEDWVVYPYEKQEEPGSEIITRMLEFLGEDPKREGLRETPARVARAWQELFGGYAMDPKLTTFEDGLCDEMVVSRDIRFASFCEHHMLPFFGSAHVGYLPGAKIIGVSKLSRVVEKFARRLQVQERLTQQVALELERALEPRGVAVVVEATHFCMVMRGVRQPDSTMVTSAMRGVFRDRPETRAEFLALIRRSA